MKKVLLTLTICIMMVLSLGGTVFANDEDNNQDGENTSEQVQEEIEQEEQLESKDVEETVKENIEVTKQDSNEEADIDEQSEDESNNTSSNIPGDQNYVGSESNDSLLNATFTIDGDYSEWSQFEHKSIWPENWYTNGYDQEGKPIVGDPANLALGVIINNVYYMHSYTVWPSMLNQNGVDYSSITLWANDNNLNTTFKYILINDDGSVNPNYYDADFKLPNGHYHFYLSVSDVNNQVVDFVNKNKSDILESEYIVGEAYITVDDPNREEMECYINLELLNKVYEELQLKNKIINLSDATKIGVVFNKFGGGVVIWSEHAGTPTGVVGVIACASIAAGSYYFIDKKRKLH